LLRRVKWCAVQFGGALNHAETYAKLAVKRLGVWLMIACFAWLAFSFTGLLFPAWDDKAFSITQPIALGEVATMLWLMIMGAKEKRLAAAS
jgi:hypothetical protein